MNSKEELSQVNKDILNKQLDYIEAKSKYLEEKQKLASAKAQISLTDKDTWKELGITNQDGRDAYARKQTEALQENLHQAQITMDYLAVQENIIKTN